MRTLTGAEATALDAAVRRNAIKVEIQNGDGTWIDYSDRLIGGGFGRSENQSITSVSVELRRDKSPAVANSLSPFMEGSTLNRLDDGATFSPAIDAGRGLRISIATVAAGTTPGAGDYHVVFRGITDETDTGKNPLTVEAHDLGSHLKERFIEQETTYEQAPMEDMIQSIFSDWTAGITLYSLNGTAATPFAPADSPGYMVNETTFDGISTWNAAERIAQLAGWTMRFRWNESVGDYVATLMEPDRDRETNPTAPGFSPDWTHKPSRYFVVPRLATGKKGVRNAIGGYYHDEDGVKQEVATITDAFSIGKYDRQFFGLREGTDSPINTLAEFQTMQGKALADLKDPAIEQEIELPLFWPVELGDLYLFKANGVHYDVDQGWVVVGYRHNLTRERTTITVRGKASGGYRNWLERPTKPGEEPGIGPDNPAYMLYNIRLDPTGETETHYLLRWDAGSRVEEVWLGALKFEGEEVTGPMQDAAKAAAAWVADGSGAALVPKPEEGEFTVCALAPIVFAGGVSRDLGWVVFPISGDRALIIPIGPFFSENAAGTESTVRLGLIDPRGVTKTPRIFIKDVVPDAPEPTGTAMTVDPGTGYWTDTFDLDRKHDREVTIHVDRTDGGPTLYLGPFSVDSGKRAEVTDVRVTQLGDGVAQIEAAFDTDTDPTHASGGAQYRLDGGAWSDLTVSGFEALWTVTQSEADAIEMEVRGVNKAGEWGPEFGPVVIPQWTPPPTYTVQVPENAAGDEATPRIQFDDPLDVITGVDVEVVGPGFDAGSEPVAAVEDSGWWERVIELATKHPLLVYFHNHRSNGPSFTAGPYTTDSNKTPEVTAGPSVEYDQAGTGYVSIQYDTDGDEYQYRVEEPDGTVVDDWSTYAALVNFAATFPVAQDPETELVVKIRARSAGGLESEISDIGLEQWVPDNPPFEVEFAENTAGSESTMTLTPEDPAGVVEDITIHEFRGGVETVVPTGDITVTGTGWEYTFDLPEKPHVVMHRVQVQRWDSMPNYWLGPFTSDSDKAADVRELKATYDGAGIASVTARFDTDTVVGLGEARYRLDGGAWVDDELVVGTDLVAVFDIDQTTSAQLLEVAGRNKGGAWGEPAPLEIEAYTADPRFTAARCFGVWNAGSAGWDYTISWGAADAAGLDVSIDYLRNGVWVGQETGIDPESSPESEFIAGGASTDRVSAILYLIDGVNTVGSITAQSRGTGE